MTLDKTELKKIIESWSNKMHSTFFDPGVYFTPGYERKQGLADPVF